MDGIRKTREERTTARGGREAKALSFPVDDKALEEAGEGPEASPLSTPSSSSWACLRLRRKTRVRD